MMISAQPKYFQGSRPMTLREPERTRVGPDQDGSGGSIPQRYRDGRGGINLEQVRRDQRQARQQVVRALVRRFKKLWRPSK